MASVLYQSIELLSREKGIDPGIVVGAVEEAIALATRKYYKTQENMRGELNKETGEITAYIYKTVVADDEPIEDPVNQITLTEANELAPGVEVGSEIRIYRDTSSAGPHCRAAGQAGHLPEGPRSRARYRLPGVRPPRKGSAERHRQAHRGPGRHLRPGQGRSPLPQARAVAAGAVLHRRAGARGAAQSRPRRQGAAGDRLPRRAGAGVRTCSSPKFRRSTTTPSSSAPSRAKPASAPRSPFRAATRTWTRWAHAWA